MMLTNKAYDVLKWVAQYFIPAAGTLYFAIAQIWNLPYGEQVVGTLTAIDAFLGALMGLSSRNYKGEGTIHVNTSDPSKDIMTFEFDDDTLVDLPKREKITMRIQTTPVVAESQDLQSV